MATTQITSADETADPLDRPTGLLSEIREFWQQFFVAAFSPYRPELHYMRGPGPAWRAKHGQGPH
jgi:hypothetical protein